MLRCIPTHYQQIWSMLLYIFKLCSYFGFLSLPKVANSLKTIYQVLKFAAKHKAPLGRSALTYWEEDIPLRIDLGKSRYGGPFTTEQVEDVKTLFHLTLTPIGLHLCAQIMRLFHSLCFITLDFIA